MYEHTMCSVNERYVLLCQSNTSRVVGLARLVMTARKWPDAALPDGGQMAIARSKGREAEAMGMSHVPLPPHSSRGLDARSEENSEQMGAVQPATVEQTRSNPF